MDGKVNSGSQASESFADVIVQLEERVPRKVLARMFDVEDRTIGHWADGRSKPTMDVLRRGLRLSSDEVRGVVMAFLLRGTNWAAAPVQGEGGFDQIKAAANVLTEAAELAQAVAHGKPQSVIESEAADVTRAASQVPAADRVRLAGRNN